MLKPPCRLKIVGVIDLISVIEVDDAMDAVFVAVGLGHSRMRGEHEASGFQDQMIGDVPGRRQIFFQQRGRHRQRFSRIVETCLIGGIDREFSRGTNVGARQIANRIVVLGMTEPSRQDRSRIARVAPRFVFAHITNPSDDGLPLIGRWLRQRLFGRHFFGLNPFEHDFPDALILRDCGERGITAQVEFAFLLLFAVTGLAMTLEEGSDDIGKAPL